MSERDQSIPRLFKVERLISYPFPMLVGVFSSFITVAFYSVLGLRFFRGVGVFIPSSWNATVINSQIDETIYTIAVGALGQAFFNISAIVMFIAPLIFAFNYAQGFATGKIRTLLSYPIGRRKMFIMKIVFIILILAISLTISGILSLICYYPFYINPGLLVLFLVSSWVSVLIISSTCTFIATFSRSAPVTAFLGIGLWFVGFIFAVAPFSPILLKQLFFPWVLTSRYLNPIALSYLEPVTFNDVFGSIFISLALSLFLLLISILRFERMEV